jgi:hypothetical protein
MGKDPSRYLGLTRDISFVLHHLATVAVARDNAPWLRGIKDRAFRRAIDQLNLDDGKNRAVLMPEIEAKNGKLSHAEFMAASDYYQKPLIVRGWFAGARALKEWSPDNLPKYVGSQEIPCVIRDSQVQQGSRDDDGQGVLRPRKAW